MKTYFPLPENVLRPYIKTALLEDLARKGDITSEATVDKGKKSALKLVSRQSGVIAGMDLARLAFLELDPNINFHALVSDGQEVSEHHVLATIKGDAHAILAAERSALNFLSHLSGIATQTHHMLSHIKHTQAKLTCTRKTLPGLRVLQKYAVRVGGGVNHRMALDDMMMIKDNHIALAGGVALAIQKAKACAGHLIPIEVEVDNLVQLKTALAEGVTFVLLDNMPINTLKEAVSLCRNKALTEASGGVNANTIKAIAETGVDFIAVGALTHSVVALDIGLDYE